MNHPVVPSVVAKEGGSPAPIAERDLYGLLGLTPFEPNPEVISAKVRDLMREVRKYQVGPYAARTQTRMEELAAATAFLLDPKRKESYDEELRRQYGMPPISIASTYAGPTATSPPTDTDASLVARKADRWRRSILALAVVSLLVAAGWGLTLLMPTTSRTPTPPPESNSDGTPAIPRTPNKADQAKRAVASTPKRGTGDVERSSPTIASRTIVGAQSSERDESPDVDSVAFGDRPTNTELSDSVERPPERIDANAHSANATERPTVLTAPATPSRSAASQGIVRSEPGRPGATAKPAQKVKKRADESGLHLSPAEVLRELRDMRLKRSPAQRLATNPRTLGDERAVELVRYARSAFADERRFQRQLEQEVVALKRVYPQLRDRLPDQSR